VLTDGGVTWGNDGIEQKTFHIRDGLGLRLWQRAGGRTGIVTGRASRIVQLRAEELGIEIVRQGVEDKLGCAEGILADCGLAWDRVAYVGDDLPDLAVIRRAGVGIAVADACPEARRAAAWVTGLPGGRGAVREVVERMLRARGSWDGIVSRYGGSGPTPAGPLSAAPTGG